MNSVIRHMSRLLNTQTPPSLPNSPLPTSTPIPTISHFAYPSTPLQSTLSHQQQTQLTSLPFSSFPHLPSPTLLAQSAQLVSVFVLLIIAYRTYHYINLRRNGLVGPSAAPPLIKLWSLYGFIQFASQVLSLYLSPLHADWIISTLHALILVILLSVPRLRAAHLLYDRKLSPFYDTYAPQVEQQFAVARKHWDEINDAFRELATYLLKRIAVGGLSNAIVLPSIEEHSQSPAPQPSVSSERRRGAPLPKETAVFPTGRKFFAGEAEQRAETVINARSGSIGDAIQVAIPEAPRPLYEEARAMRAHFRKRTKKTKSPKTDPS